MKNSICHTCSVENPVQNDCKTAVIFQENTDFEDSKSINITVLYPMELYLCLHFPFLLFVICLILPSLFSFSAVIKITYASPKPSKAFVIVLSQVLNEKEISELTEEPEQEFTFIFLKKRYLLSFYLIKFLRYFFAFC